MCLAPHTSVLSRYSNEQIRCEGSLVTPTYMYKCLACSQKQNMKYYSIVSVIEALAMSEVNKNL